MIELLPQANSFASPKLQSSAPEAGARDSQTAPSNPSPNEDVVELSPAARSYTPEKHAVDPHILEVRRQIAAGTYLTDEKVDQAVETLFKELRGRALRIA